MDKIISDKKRALQVSRTSIIVNVLLALGKVIAGIVGRSGAMVSDGIHSASDVFSTIVVIIGIKMSAKPSDREHPYGHERFECITAIILSISLLATAVGLGYYGISSIINGIDNIPVPGILPLIFAIISIVVKEWMYRYTKSVGKKINSEALIADAWHHRSDALSSIGSLIGIAGARMGFPVLDSIASIVICGFIVKAGLEIFGNAAKKLVDHSCDSQTENAMIETILSVNGVRTVDELHTREFGSKIYVDVEIGVSANETFVAAHNIAETVHDRIEADYEGIKHCMVHVNPVDVV